MILEMSIFQLSETYFTCRFGHVVKDNSYFKPVAYSTARHLSSCAGAVKAHNIVYVARYTPQKGQVEFVKHIDPKILENFTIHFYGGESTSKYAEELKAEVARTGLKAVVHGRVPHRQLLDAVCHSSAQVLNSVQFLSFR